MSPPPRAMMAAGIPERLLSRERGAASEGDLKKQIDVFHDEDETIGYSPAFYLVSTASLSAKDDVARRILDTHRGDEWVHLRQMVALPMLEQHLRQEEPNLDQVQLYTRALVEFENPNADLIASALRVLQQQWTDAELGAAVLATTSGAERWLMQTCPGCDVGEALSSADAPQEASQQTERRAAILHGLNQLRSAK
jgi:hypothetical protein